MEGVRPNIDSKVTDYFQFNQRVEVINVDSDDDSEAVYEPPNQKKKPDLGPN